MATGNPPLANQDPTRAIFLIPRSAAPALPSGFSSQLSDLVSSCLKLNPDEVCHEMVALALLLDRLTVFSFQRPSAQELLKSKFVRGAPKGTDRLLQLISRYDKWKLQHKNDMEVDQTSFADTGRGVDEAFQDEDWVFDTVKADQVSHAALSSNDAAKQGEDIPQREEVDTTQSPVAETGTVKLDSPQPQASSLVETSGIADSHSPVKDTVEITRPLASVEAFGANDVQQTSCVFLPSSHGHAFYLSRR